MVCFERELFSKIGKEPKKGGAGWLSLSNPTLVANLGGYELCFFFLKTAVVPGAYRARGFGGKRQWELYPPPL